MSLESSLERIAAALETIAAKEGCLPPPPEAVEKKKPGRPAKAAEPVVEVDPLGDEPTAKAISQDDVHKALRGFMDKNGIDKTKAFMIKHGANPAKPVLTSIPEKNYPAIMAELGA